MHFDEEAHGGYGFSHRPHDLDEPGAFGSPRRRSPRGRLRGVILRSLLEQPRHGYEIIQLLSERSGGMWQPSPGSIYPTLSLLEDAGLVTAAVDGGRKTYTLTETGRLEAERVPVGFASPREGADGITPLAQAATTTMQTTRQVMMTGTPAQQEEATKVLLAARRSLHRILAEEPTD
ncbi:MAG: PadR family transcriptional regulator [Ferrimicrobium sp.]